MRIITVLYISFFITGCFGPKFTTMSDKCLPSAVKLHSFQMDSTYTLYVRQVIRHFEPATQTFKLVNDRIDNQDSLIEREYMFLSRKDSEVLVVNNVPNIYQSIAEKDKTAGFTSIADTSIAIDIWFFRQFRFGKLVSPYAVRFYPADDRTIYHTWNFTPDATGALTLESIATGDDVENRKRIVKPAFAINVIYKKVDAYKLVYVRKKRKHLTPIETIDLPPESLLYLYHKKKKKWFVYFKFDQPVDGGIQKNIRFRKRLYAAPADLTYTKN